MRRFNITGVCVPKMHYMVDITEKLNKITQMVDEGLYFTINRARQYGKTTTFFLLGNKLSGPYVVASISFEGIDTDTFKSPGLFCPMFVRNFRQSLRFTNTPKECLAVLENNQPETVEELGGLITEFCEKSEKPVVLMIDEVDKTSDNQIFLDFLGMLRNKYLLRNQGRDITFQSVILAGVYDVKNLKRKITGEQILSDRGERIYNSPWNIAADFNVDMSFHPAEISTMLTEYEKDFHTGMDITRIAEAIYKHTNGYPFLTSKLCKIIDEDLDKDWTANGVLRAVKLLLKDNNTLFDDMFKNIENNKKLYNLLFDIVINGKERPFAMGHPEIELGSMFGILENKDGKVAVSNEIFELLITNYLSAKMSDIATVDNKVFKEDVISNGQFNMQLCLEKFAGHFYELYNQNDDAFLERQCRLLFITYLVPLINGQGFYHIEAQTRNTLRMDLVVDYLSQQFIVELKLWHGDKKHEDAYRQLCEYLDAKGKNEGYLLTFDFRKTGKQTKAEWVEWNGKRIFDIVV